MQSLTRQQTHVLWMSALLFGLYALLVARLFALQFTEAQGFAERQSRALTRSPHKIGAAVFERGHRGAIVDRNGSVLATSYDTYRLFVDPCHADIRKSAKKRASAVIEILLDRDISGFDRADVISRVCTTYFEREGDRVPIRYRFLVGGILPDQRRDIEVLMAQNGIRGFFFEADEHRSYPQKDLTAQVVGYVGHNAQDDSERARGRHGVELYLEAVLAGTDGEFVCEKDARQSEIDVNGYWRRPPVRGRQVRLTLDVRIQAIVAAALEQGYRETECEAVTAIVLDTRNGDVLAMKSEPDFDPADLRLGLVPVSTVRCRAVEDSYEPGSTFKPFIMAKALEWGFVRWDDTIDTHHGQYTFSWHRARRLLRDSSAHGVLTVREVITKSSNIGMAVIGYKKLGVERLYDAVETFGFDEPVEICLPSKARGRFTARAVARKKPLSAVVSIPFGHEITMSPLVLASKYSIFGTGGVWHQPTLVMSIGDELDEEENERRSVRYMPQGIADEMKQVLREVVTDGTARVLRSMKWHAIAKTGTAQIIGPDGFEGAYNSSLVAMAPLEKPRFTVLVVFHRVRGRRFYGGTVAGPVVRKILEGSLETYRIPESRGI